MGHAVGLEVYLARMCPLRGEIDDNDGVLTDAYSGYRGKGDRTMSPMGGIGGGIVDRNTDVNKLADDILKETRGKWKTTRDIEDNPDFDDHGRAIEMNQDTKVYEKFEENAKLYREGKGIVLTITGSRTYNNASEFAKMIKELEEQTGKKVVMIQQGGARGADSIARQYAFDNGLSSNQYDADWTGKGLKAGVVRNSTMLKGLMSHEYAGNEKIVMAIYDGEVSRGTSDMLKKSMLAGINTKYYGVTRDQYRDKFVIPYLTKYSSKNIKSNSPGIYDEEDDQ